MRGRIPVHALHQGTGEGRSRLAPLWQYSQECDFGCNERQTTTHPNQGLPSDPGCNLRYCVSVRRHVNSGATYRDIGRLWLGLRDWMN